MVLVRFAAIICCCIFVCSGELLAQSDNFETSESRIVVENTVLQGLSGKLTRVRLGKHKRARSERTLSKELKGSTISFKANGVFDGSKTRDFDGFFNLNGKQRIKSLRRGVSVRSGITFSVAYPEIAGYVPSTYQDILNSQARRIRLALFNNGRTILRVIARDSRGQLIRLVFRLSELATNQQCPQGFQAECSPKTAAGITLGGGDTCSCEPICEDDEYYQCTFGEFENGPCYCVKLIQPTPVPTVTPSSSPTPHATPECDDGMYFWCPGDGIGAPCMCVPDPQPTATPTPSPTAAPSPNPTPVCEEGYIFWCPENDMIGAPCGCIRPVPTATPTPTASPVPTATPNPYPRCFLTGAPWCEFDGSNDDQISHCPITNDIQLNLARYCPNPGDGTQYRLACQPTPGAIIIDPLTGELKDTTPCCCEKVYPNAA